VPNFKVDNGWVQLSNEPGLGVVPDLAACKGYAVEVPMVGV
jgi:D-galactarolactone cycloisomerase